MRAKLLRSLIDSKVRFSDDCLSIHIMNDLGLELGLQLTYKQTWRVKEYFHMLELGRPIGHYESLRWLCSSIVRANSDSMVFCELEGVRFKRVFVA